MNRSTYERASLPLSPRFVRVAKATDVGLLRERNEDSLAAIDIESERELGDEGVDRIRVAERGVLLAVADGMGGHPNGDVASSVAIENLVRGMRRATRSGAGSAAVHSAVDRAHRAVHSEAAGTFGPLRMGTTLTAIHVCDDEAHIAHVGDSRAYVLRGGKLHRLTKDHSYGQVLVDAGVLGPGEEDRSPIPGLLQVVGQIAPLTIELSTLKLRDRDCLLICSDGLTGPLSDDDIATTILASPSLEQASERLVELANLRGGEDNVTLVLAGVSGRLPAADDDFARTHKVLKTFTPAVKSDRPLPFGVLR